jgi:NACalpha-BTF3-like transcription factor
MEQRIRPKLWRQIVEFSADDFQLEFHTICLMCTKSNVICFAQQLLTNSLLLRKTYLGIERHSSIGSGAMKRDELVQASASAAAGAAGAATALEADADDGGEAAEGAKATKEQQKSTADLDRVTDHVEERDIDSAALKDSMQAMLGSAAVAKKTDKAARDRELAKVKIQQADVDVIVEELELDQKTAERALREASGDLVQALCALVD